MHSGAFNLKFIIQKWPFFIYLTILNQIFRLICNDFRSCSPDSINTVNCCSNIEFFFREKAEIDKRTLEDSGTVSNNDVYWIEMLHMPCCTFPPLPSVCMVGWGSGTHNRPACPAQHLSDLQKHIHSSSEWRLYYTMAMGSLSRTMRSWLYLNHSEPQPQLAPLLSIG